MIVLNKKLTTLSTEWGYVAAVWSDRGLWELGWFCKDRGQVKETVNTADAEEISLDWQAEELQRELNIYLKGYRAEFGTPIDWSGYTQFQRMVLQHTANIPYGKVETYGQVAGAVGSPKAARAVGQSLHINRTPLVVPCHRVIGANGNLTGFGGGLELKKALLLLEQTEEI